MLLGRDGESERIAELVAAVADGGAGALRLTGEPGVGKTALLDHGAAVAAARGVRVVRLAGVAAESALPFAAVQRLLLALGVPVESLPPLQRETLEIAFGLSTGPAPDRFRIGAAVRAALVTAAADGPLLACVDDLQWLDPDSREVLAFAARRLHEAGLGLLAAERDPLPGPFDDLPVLPVAGLPPAPAAALLRRVLGRAIDPPIADRIVTATAGNPLALVELAPGLSGHQLVGGTLLPEPLPIGPTLERHYLRRVHALPAATQTWLLVAATVGSGDPGPVAAAAAVLGTGLDAAGPAEDEGLVRVGTRVEFRHPLVAAAVYAGATGTDRRRAHRAVAHALGEGTIGHAWHLASAAVGVDESIAAALAEAADRAAVRGGQAARARLLERAAELSPAGPARTDRWIGAAEASTVAGYPAHAGEIVEALGVEELAGVPRGRALLARAEVRLVSGVADLVHAVPALCLQAADAFAGRDPDRELAAVLRAQELLFVVEGGATGTDPVALALRARQALDRHETAGLPGPLIAAMAALALSPYPEAAPLLRRAVDALLAADPATVLRFTTMGVALTTAAFDDAARDRLLRTAAQEARRTGALQLLNSLLWMHAQSIATLGRPDVADTLLRESRATARSIGLSPVVDAIYVNATGRAWRGGENEDEDVRAEIAAAAAVGRAIGMDGMDTIARHAQVLLDLADGRFAEARETASAIRGERFLQVALIVLADLVEAAAGSGHDGEAADAAAELDTIAAAAGTDLAAGLAARARALAGGADPDAAFRESAEHLSRTLALGELARTRLLYGEWLRRGRRRRDAREELRAALAGFEALGAAPFAARARRELRATGDHATSGGLTPQERSVAELAAGGATNVEIAERLSLSRHTVDYHLRKVFRKLDVTDRRALGAALLRTTHTT